MQFARAEFFLAKPQKDGKTLRWHLQVVSDAVSQFGGAGGQFIPEEYRDSWEMFADPPQIPYELSYLWGWFLQLHQSRGNNGMGQSPITFQDMLAWSQVTGNKLQAFELDAIIGLDRIYLESLENTVK